MKRVLRTIGVLALIFLGANIGGAISEAWQTRASRDAAGTYTLPVNSENPAVAGTPIKSADHNATANDIKTELTDSLSRSAKGGMLAALRLNAGVSLSNPDLAWAAEIGTGWRRAAAGDIRFGVSGADKQFLSATGLGIGVAPTRLFDVSSTATVTTDVAAFLVPSLANGNGANLWVGTAVGTNTAAALRFFPSATAANSTACVTVGGQTSTLCVDGNNKTIIGGSGTGISASIRSTVSWTPGSVGAGLSSTNNMTVTGAAAGADCVVTGPTSGDGMILRCNVTLNTCSMTVWNPSAGALTATSGTYACRVFNP